MSERLLDQNFDFLGSLRERLAGLTGFETMAMELIQNAEDAKADYLCFDFRTDELVVENTSDFRDIDFERMRHLASGDKRKEQDTIGMFGIGFVSVYHITDRPQVMSDGKHWTFRPEEEKRILEKSITPTPGHTKFILPWAFDQSSKVRSELALSAVQEGQVSDFQEDLRSFLPHVLLFLEKLACIEMRNNGEKTLTVRREGDRDSGEICITVCDRSLLWRIFKAEFERPESAQIEQKKKTEVSIALPQKSSEDQGLLFAFLPTQHSTGFPFHINADFYPTPERKDIILNGNDYRVEWNKRALERAAELLSESLEEIRDTLGRVPLFVCLEAAKEKEKHPVFACFWSVLKDTAKSLPIIFTSQDEWKKAGDVFLLRDEEEEDVRPLLEDLGLSFAHSDLRSYWNILTELGAQIFGIEDLVEALKSVSVEAGTALTDAPSPLNGREKLKVIYHEFDRLIGRIHNEKRRTEIKENVIDLCLGLSTLNKIHPLQVLRRANKEDQETFGFLGDKVLFADELDNSEAFIVRAVPRFQINDALEALKHLSRDDFLDEYTSTEGSWRPLKVYHFFTKYSQNFQQSRQLREQFLDIPMFMAHEEFRALRYLSLPGEFKDPLRLDILINKEELDGTITDFLKSLGVSELDLATYAKQHIPAALQVAGVTPADRRVLVDELSKGLSLIRDDKEAISTLCGCSIVECEDGEFRKGCEVYLESPKINAVLGESGYHKVSYPKDSIPNSYKDFYHTIGVSESPRPHDIVDRVKRIIRDHPAPEVCQRIEEIFYFLSESWNHLDENDKEDFSELKNLEWLPEEGNTESWFKPCNLDTRARSYLFQTQGRFLKFRRSPRESFQSYLGLNVEPSAEQVVNHLLTCSEKNLEVHKEVYRFLSDNSTKPCIHRLKGEKCIDIGEGNFVEPNKLFWQKHPFGEYRHQLDSSLRPFNEFFKVVGLKEAPELNDYIAVILEVSEEFGNLKRPLDQQTLVIIHNCFAYLQQRLESGEITVADLTKDLQGKKIVPQIRSMLYPPEWVFFKDKSGVAEKFDGRLADNVIDRDQETWLVLEKLGVMPLSSAVKCTISKCIGDAYDQSLTTLIKERWKSIKRIVDSRKKQIPEGWQSEMLEGLEVYKVGELEVVYSLEALANLKSSPVSENVFLDSRAKRFYVNYKDKTTPPFRDIARELALALNPTVDLSDMGLGINEILRSDSPEEAETMLDEYGIDKGVVTPEPSEVVPGKVVVTVGKEGEEIETQPAKFDRKIQEAEDGEKDKEKDTPAKARLDLGGEDAEQEETEKATPSRRARLRSYVLSPEQAKKRESQESGVLSEAQKQAINKAGIKRAMEHEKDENRVPKEMPHFHEGYDIESYNDKGEIERYIEVKSTKSKWDGFEVELTSSQFEKARELGKRYFLYVIDNALTENPGLYVIQNPALRASGYLYDRPWADSDSRNE